MGECACGQEQVEFVLPGPDGIRYGIEIYSGCHYCGSGPALAIYRCTEEYDDEEYFLLHGAKEPEWVEHIDGVQFFGHVLITQEAFATSLLENNEEMDSRSAKRIASGRTLEDAIWNTAATPSPNNGSAAAPGEER